MGCVAGDPPDPFKVFFFFFFFFHLKKKKIKKKKKEKTLKPNLTILTSKGIKKSLFRYHTYVVTSIQRVLKNI
jgi:hypothetical protein